MTERRNRGKRAFTRPEVGSLLKLSSVCKATDNFPIDADVRIGFITPPPSKSIAQMRIEGFKKAFLDADLPIRPEYLIDGGFELQDASTATGSLVIVSQTGAAGGFVVFTNTALLDKLGLKIPSTYEELKQVGDSLRAKGFSAFTHPGKVIYMWPVWFFTTFAQTTGNRSIERTVEILSGKGKFTDPDFVEALDLVFQFSRDKLFSPGVFGLDFANAQSEFQTGKACFYLFHDSIAKGLHDAEGPNLKLDFMLMPNLVKKPVVSQYPGGPGLVMAIPAKIDPTRKEAALHLIDFLSSDDVNRESMLINGGAVPVNANVQPSDLPFYQKEKTEISKMVTYLDWFYPPEITTALQEGLQAGLAGRITAEALAKNLQAVLDRLSGGGYHFAG